jgi:hypothetical protein
MSGIFMNGIPMIWITVDENSNGDMQAYLSPEYKDYLIRADLWDGTIPKDYWDKKENDNA